MSLSDDLLNPIDGPNPAGANLRYEPIYDEIKEARREEDDAPKGAWESARKMADPVKVIKLATDALSKQTKDLQIAAWLTEALLRRDGFGGLREGLTLIHGLMEKFWDHVYPEIEEDDDLELRAAPLAWVGIYLEYPTKLVALNSRGHTYIEYKDAKSLGYEEDAEETGQKEARAQAAAEEKLLIEEFDEGFEATPKAWYKTVIADIDESLAQVKALEAFGDEKLGNDAPSFAKLRDPVEEVRRSVQQLLDKKLELDPDPIEEEAVDDGTPDTAALTADGGLPVEPTSVADAAGRVAAAARFLQHADPKNPGSYLMLRGFRWGELRALGGGIDPKMLSAPPTAVRTRLKGMLLDGKWPELLAAAEGVMATPHGRGWLDLQRYVLTACDNLGAEYDPVAKSIRGAMGALLRDLPELSQQTLMDDTPTANRETLLWLREHVSTDAVDEPEIPMPSAADTADADEAATGAGASSGMARSIFDRAMVQVRSGNPQKGIELLMQQAEKEKSPRDRFLRKAEAAGIMVDSGLAEVALPTLRQLAEQIEAHQLEGWEAGDVVARPMALLFRCLRGIEGESEATQSLYQRIARLDPMQAMAATNDPVSASPPGDSDGEAQE